MVWKFCEIRKSNGTQLSKGPNSVRFYLTVWGMACIKQHNMKQISQLYGPAHNILVLTAYGHLIHAYQLSQAWI